MSGLAGVGSGRCGTDSCKCRFILASRAFGVSMLHLVSVGFMGRLKTTGRCCDWRFIFGEVNLSFCSRSIFCFLRVVLWMLCVYFVSVRCVARVMMFRLQVNLTSATVSAILADFFAVDTANSQQEVF